MWEFSGGTSYPKDETSIRRHTQTCTAYPKEHSLDLSCVLMQSQVCLTYSDSATGKREVVWAVPRDTPLNEHRAQHEDEMGSTGPLCTHLGLPMRF